MGTRLRPWGFVSGQIRGLDVTELSRVVFGPLAKIPPMRS